MEKNLKLYGKIVGNDIINKIYSKAKKFSGKHIICISSTYQGGGVAEILNSIVPLFNEIGIELGWRTLNGSPDFFTVTKKFHNALQGERINLSKRKKEIYYETNKRFSNFTHIDHDLVVIHDPQPLPLVKFYRKAQPWIFRCHIDLTSPNPEVWDYLKKIIAQYDHMIVSKKDYIKNDLEIPQSVIYPAIDPLSIKNKPISRSTISKYLNKFEISEDKPIISQISRFDKWKDPIGVVKVFEVVRKKINSQLVLLGSIAPDDPEGQKIFEDVKKAVEKNRFKKDIKVLLVNSEILVNSLQRASSVVIQKSLREGFGLVISETLYKGTPVVASNVGGIPLQIINGVNGFLHSPKDIEGFSRSIIKIMKDEKMRDMLGKNGRIHVKNNFLITRLIDDWLDIFEKHLI